MAETLSNISVFHGSQAASRPTFGKPGAPGLKFDRHFTKPGVSPFDEITWELRDAIIQDWKGKLIFEQKNVEVPADWSMTATNIVASKYLHGQIGTPQRESGVRALITRVAESMRDWGIRDGYFASQEDANIFFAELSHLLLNQKVAFNSPVWFNVGCDRLEPNSDAQNWHWNAEQGKIAFSVTGYTKPQCSACFINSVNDSLDSILTLAKTEGMLFKWGSGAGSNLSAIRGSMETLSGGGTASGPLSFMRGFDAFAGVIKSGGKTRRAAKMVILNIDHPDIEDFIECKVKEERKAWHLMQAGYDGSSPDAEAYSSIFFQNANNSVRVTDEFMHAVETDGSFTTRTVKGKEPVKEYKARDLMHKIAEATWQCGDPGMQYDTTINRWHTSKNTARINASNPCSEYMFLDDSACNLASFNLIKFLKPGGQFDIDSYRHAISVVTTAMEIIVDAAGYPTEQIAKNSHDYRPLGLGYANLGALLMDRRPALRLRRRPRLRRHAHRHPLRRRLRPVRPASPLTAPRSALPPPSPSAPASTAEPAPASTSTASPSSTSSACTAPKSTTSTRPSSSPPAVMKTPPASPHLSCLSSRPPARPHGTKPSSSAKSSASATLRSPSSPPLAPSAS